MPRAFFVRDYALRGLKAPPHPRKRPRRQFTPSDPPPFMLHGAKARGASSYFASRPEEVHTYRPFEALQAQTCAVSINLAKCAGSCRKSAQESSSLTFPYQTDPEMSKTPWSTGVYALLPGLYALFTGIYALLFVQVSRLIS